MPAFRPFPFLLILVLTGWLPRTYADPIVLTATSVTMASTSRPVVLAVSGPGFNFGGEGLGEPYPQFTNPGTTYIGLSVLFGGSFDPGRSDGPLQGFIDVNGGSVRALFGGFATTPTVSPVFPSDIATLPSVFSVPLPISGTFTACLQQTGTFVPSAPCDPNFLNYAVIDIALPGVYNFYFAPPFSPYPPIEITGFSYAAAASAVPEPSGLTLLGVGVLFTLFAAHRFRVTRQVRP